MGRERRGEGGRENMMHGRPHTMVIQMKDGDEEKSEKYRRGRGLGLAEVMSKFVDPSPSPLSV